MTTLKHLRSTREEWLALSDQERADVKVRHIVFRAWMDTAREGNMVIEHNGTLGFASLNLGSATRVSHRYMLLAWAFIRGIPFRRVEGRHHTQKNWEWPTLTNSRCRGFWLDGAQMLEHNLPDHVRLLNLLTAFGLAPTIQQAVADAADGVRRSEVLAEICTWLANPDGAVEPPKRVKRPYVRQPDAVTLLAETKDESSINAAAPKVIWKDGDETLARCPQIKGWGGAR